MADNIDLNWPSLSERGNFSVTKEGQLACTGATFNGSLGGAKVDNKPESYTLNTYTLEVINDLGNFTLYLDPAPVGSFRNIDSRRYFYVTPPTIRNLKLKTFNTLPNMNIALTVFATTLSTSSSEYYSFYPRTIYLTNDNEYAFVDSLIEMANTYFKPSSPYNSSTTGMWYMWVPNWIYVNTIDDLIENLKNFYRSYNDGKTTKIPDWFGIIANSGSSSNDYDPSNNRYYWWDRSQSYKDYQDNIQYYGNSYWDAPNKSLVIPVPSLLGLEDGWSHTITTLEDMKENYGFICLYFQSQRDFSPTHGWNYNDAHYFLSETPCFIIPLKNITLKIQNQTYNTFSGSYSNNITESKTMGGHFHSNKSNLGDNKPGFCLNSDGLGVGPGYYFESGGKILCSSIAGNHYTSSDIRLKNSIKPIIMQPTLSKFFDDLKPVSYKFKNDKNNRGHIGFVADDVKQSLIKNGMNPSQWGLYESIMPMPGTQEGCQGLRYNEFIALNTSEIQKLKTKMDELEKKAEAIKSLDEAEKNSYNSKEEKQGDNIK